MNDRKRIAIKIKSHCSINAIYAIDFTGDDDLKIAQSLYRDHFTHETMFLPPQVASSSGEVNYFLDHVLHEAKYNGLQPILLFDGHGVKEGLNFGMNQYDSELAYRTKASEYHDAYSWIDLLYKLRGINIATGNNLIVLFSTCNASNILMINHMLHMPAPYFYVVAPKETIFDKVSKESYIKFITEILDSGNLTLANKLLPKQNFYTLSSEYYIAKSLLLLFSHHFSGKGYKEWKESALTHFQMLQINPTKEKLSEFRKQFKATSRDLDLKWNFYRSQYLLGDDSRNHERFNYDLPKIIHDAAK